MKFKIKNLTGFSLLEVMVALAILALSFTTLILVQGRTTNLALQARNISIATELARFQLVECKRKVREVIANVGDFKLEGDFTELGYPKFKWECHAPKFNMKTPSTSQIEENIKQNTPESQKKNVGTSSSISAPFISMITDALGNSVRELAVIIRWSDINEDELRVVTHVTDLASMAGLSRMLAEGARTFEQLSTNKKNQEEKEGKPEVPPQIPPQMPPSQIPPPQIPPPRPR